jgi:hypothetical protein
MSTRRGAVAGLSALLACAGLCQADILTFQPGSGDFYDDDNWLSSAQQNAFPSDEDRIVIPAGKTCHVVASGQMNEFTIDTMEIQWSEQEGDGVLNIANGITFILENDDGNVCGGGLGPSSPAPSRVRTSLEHACSRPLLGSIAPTTTARPGRSGRAVWLAKGRDWWWWVGGPVARWSIAREVVVRPCVGRAGACSAGVASVLGGRRPRALGADAFLACRMSDAPLERRVRSARLDVRS